MLACKLCKREIHARCHLQTIERNIRYDAFTKTIEVARELTNFLSETETVNKNLDSKLGNIFPGTAEQEDGIRSYYSDLTEKVVKYLKEQEEKVIKKARELKEKERAHLERDALISTKMISSVKIRKQLADALKELYTTNAPETLVISNHLRKDFVVFNAMLSELQSDVDTRYNVRFLINTEVEDILTEADIVKIEVITCCHEEASAVTFQEETEVDQQELNEQVPAEDDRKAPPPYISVARNAFMQRPRPPASVPSLPADNDTRATRRPAQHSDNLHPLSLSPFLGHAVPSPYRSPGPQLQPSAPPMYRDSSAPQISFAEARSDALPRRATVAQRDKKPIPSDATNVAFRYKTKISTKTTGDRYNPSLVGVATLGEYFIIADQKNHRLMRIRNDSVGNIVEQYECNEIPWDVTGITPTLCAVAAPKAGSILFVKFAPIPGSKPATLKRTVKVGQYLSLGYCKTNQWLLGGRGPPFSVAKIDILNLVGDLMKYIVVADSMAVPRSLILSSSRFLIFCDVHNHDVMFTDIEKTMRTPVSLRDSASDHKSLTDPQGVIKVPVLNDSCITLDAWSGDGFLTYDCGSTKSVIKELIDLKRQPDIDAEYSFVVSSDQKTLAVARNEGTVTLYDIRYT
ncbi:uncharacterized protein LOC117343381 [Pecten maximus]|uniref:uncharacterized protein LOC117343381 n=1 Tax=Pecten maximus TaxID=6579 RepID=UPI001458B16C|nr:uncharacterized protein LOC117343381 [Pecten maximus]